MFQNSFQNIERQKHNRNFWGDRSELWPSIGISIRNKNEILALSVLRKFILQIRMRSHPVGLDV